MMFVHVAVDDLVIDNYFNGEMKFYCVYKIVLRTRSGVHKNPSNYFTFTWDFIARYKARLLHPGVREVNANTPSRRFRGHRVPYSKINKICYLFKCLTFFDNFIFDESRYQDCQTC